jgi:hypothetical protein
MRPENHPVPQRFAPDQAPLKSHRQYASQSSDQNGARIEPALLFVGLEEILEIGKRLFSGRVCSGRVSIPRCLRFEVGRHG